MRRGEVPFWLHTPRNTYRTDCFTTSWTQVEKQKLESVENIPPAFWDGRTWSICDVWWASFYHGDPRRRQYRVELVPEWFVGVPKRLNQVYRRTRGDKVLRVHLQTWWSPRIKCRTSTIVGHGGERRPLHTSLRQSKRGKERKKNSVRFWMQQSVLSLVCMMSS
jgi:hypothetical protein